MKHPMISCNRSRRLIPEFAQAAAASSHHGGAETQSTGMGDTVLALVYPVFDAVAAAASPGGAR